MGNAKTLLWSAAALMMLTAGIHIYGWFLIRRQFAGDGQSIARLLWFCLDIDWLVTAAIWWLAGRRSGASLRPVAIVAAVIPLASAAGMILTLGPGFFGSWMLAVAGLLAILGARRL